MPTSHRTQSAVTGGTNRTNSKQDMKIALIGYGKMGHMIEEIARQRGHEIVSIIDVNNQDDFDSPEFASADVAIEFTNPTAAYGNYLKAFSHGVKVVSGSTGWMKDHKDDVVNLTKDGANTLFWAALAVGAHDWLVATPWSSWALLAGILLSSWLLVAEIPMFALKFKHFGLKGNELRYGFILLSIVCLALCGWTAFSFIIVLYVLVSIIDNAIKSKAKAV